MNAEQFDLYVVTLVAQALVLRLGGSVAIPVSELMAVAQQDAQWDRSGENLVIKVERACRK
jgi:hypothetical protein